MPFDPTVHDRRSHRRPGYDYAAIGGYFVTICTQNRSCLFGRVVDGKMELNDAGHTLWSVWRDLPTNHPNVRSDEFIVMPNHVHGVIHLTGASCNDGEGEDKVRPYGTHEGEHGVGPYGTREGSLGRVMQAFKSLTTNCYIDGVKQHGWNRFSSRLWQRDYFDHMIRHDESLARIRTYIRTNPQRWGVDADNPDGTGEDDVQFWVMSLERKGETCVRPVRPSVIATGGGGRTQGSPLRTPPVPPNVAKGEHAVRPYRSTPAPSVETFPPRIGHGYDLHRLQAGGPLVLAGVVVAEDVRPVAHSDGDVVLHAVVDALLGAMGWGDIGELFPNDDARWKGAASQVFVEEVMGRVAAAGYAVGNCDVTVLAERPKLKPFKPSMRSSLAGMLRVPEERVNVKAGTNEGCDAVGRGEAIAAHAVALLVRT